MNQNVSASPINLSAAEPATRLAVSRLTLTRFRNYDHLRVDVDAPAVVLTGENGAGKTNVLEAISFLVPGSGLRAARLGEVTHRRDTRSETPATGAEPTLWAVAATISTDGATDVSLGTGLVESNAHRAKRSVHVDGEAVRTQAALAEHFACHWLTPQMDRLFQGGADSRRRFLDRLVFSLDPAHAGRTSAYMHALGERRRLLVDGSRDDAWLSALEETMAAKGAAVAAARLDMASRLAHECANHDGPFPASSLGVDGLVETWLDEMPAVEVEARLKDLLRASRASDAQGRTTGAAAPGRLPHQSDLVVVHAAKAMTASHCSTGEQKMLLVGLVLAAARLATQDAGRVPVLLLDEAAAHLDERHLGALFAEVAAIGAQAWFTGTDAALFSPLAGKAQFFDVAAGAICAAGATAQ